MRNCPKCGRKFKDEISFCATDGTKLRDVSEPSHPCGDENLLAPGTVLGNYRIIDTVAVGGMGVVYEAEHTQLGKRMALKLLKSEFASNPGLVRRFFREARAANHVGHENIIEIFDFAEEGDQKYFVMEMLKGEPLTKVMQREKILPLWRTYHVGIQIADAMQAVHDAGIVHRDLKPDNIFLTERARQQDFVKLLDFGVAKLLELDDQSNPTAAGAVLGTPAYMSPEQLKGEAIDHRADVYSLGVVLFLMVTGRRPYKAKSLPELMLKAISQPTPKPSTLDRLPHEIPVELELLIMGCMEKTPEQRVQTMTEVRQRLEQLALSVEAPDRIFTLPPMDRVVDPPSDVITQSSLIVPATHGRQRALIAGLGAAVLALLVVLAVVFTGSEAPSATPIADAGPALEAPSKVNVAFDSTPRGAQVFADDEGAPLGTTPFVAQLERAEQTVRYAFRLEGHETVFLPVSLNNDAQAVVSLPASTPAIGPDADTQTNDKPKKKYVRPHKRPPKKRDKPKSKEALIDPFAQ